MKTTKARKRGHGRREQTSRRCYLEALDQRILLAAVVDWAGAHADANWSNRANWQGGTVPNNTPAVQYTAEFVPTLINGVLTHAFTVHVDKDFALNSVLLRRGGMANRDFAAWP